MDIIIEELPFEDNKLIDQYLTFQKKIHTAYYTDEVLYSRDFRKKELKTTSHPHQLKIYVMVVDKNKIIARGFLIHWGSDDDPNPERCFITVDVLPSYANKGIGTKILNKIKKLGIEHGKTVYEAWIKSTHKDVAVPWIKRLGGKEILIERKNRLYQDKLDQEMIVQWHKKLKKELKGYEIIRYWSDAYSKRVLSDDEFAKELVDFYNEVDNLIPRGDSSQEDRKLTLKQLREENEHSLINNWDGIRVLALDDEKVIGTSKVYFAKDFPLQQVNTGLTGVRKAYHKQGIGSLLKLEVLEMLSETEFRYIETENADSNTGMLKINTKLGFTEAFKYHAFEAKIKDLPD